MQCTRGAVSIFVAAMVIHAVAPAAAQTEPDRSTFSTHSLSRALDEAWSGPSDRRALGVRPEPQNPSLFKDVAGDYVRFFTARENYLILGVGLASSLSVKPLDQSIRDSGFNTELWFNEGTALDHAFEAGDVLGSSLIQVGGALATYGIGNWIGKPGVAELGRDLVRAQLVTQGVTQLLKYSVGRMRPDGRQSTVVSLGPRFRSLCQRHRAPSPLRVEGRTPGVWCGVVCGGLSPVREQALSERRGVRSSDRAHGWSYGHVPQGDHTFRARLPIPLAVCQKIRRSASGSSGAGAGSLLWPIPRNDACCSSPRPRRQENSRLNSSVVCQAASDTLVLAAPRMRLLPSVLAA